MKTPKSSLIGDAGVALVQLVAAEQLGWIVRPQLHADKGIDAQLEVVQDDKATGRLLALQVKSGKSWFREPTAGGWVFRPKEKHVRYWLGHSLPVAVVLVDLKKKSAYWQLVSKETVTSTGKGWKMTIPAANTLSMPAASALFAASEGDAYTLKLRQLQLARPWIEHLAKGGTLAVELEEWMHKSSGRASLLLTALDEDGTVVGRREWPWIFLPAADYAVELPRMFPWANLMMDDEADWASYESECGIWDKEDQRFFYVEAYDEWRADQGELGLRAARDDGEVAHWRLDLELSDLGHAFLTLDEFLSSEAIHALFNR